MATSYFEDKTKEPQDSELEIALGSTFPLFETMCKYLVDTYKDIRPEWKHYGNKTGWLLKIFKGKRNIMFVVPYEKTFTVTFTFGDKATQQVMESDISDEIKTDLQNAKKYMEGRVIVIPITDDTENVDHLINLIDIKLNN
ncbi:DUF3788 family protein [Parabacteroides segnis]|uniref:DUF3788 family protein n=1 Tax=Parabacteroides segnis TaxID=2763058 RepID=UPI003517BC60